MAFVRVNVVVPPLHAHLDIMSDAKGLGVVGESGGPTENRAVLRLLLLVAVDGIEKEVGKIVPERLQAMNAVGAHVQLPAIA